MIFSDYLNVYNFQRVLLAARKEKLHWSFMHTFEKIFLSMKMQKLGPIIWAKLNWNLFDI